jgi:hypothetical protein
MRLRNLICGSKLAVQEQAESGEQNFVAGKAGEGWFTNFEWHDIATSNA